MIFETGLRVARHFSAGLGAKILNDDFLKMSISLVQRTQFEQSHELLVTSLADADEYPGGERNGRFTGCSNDLQPHGGTLIWRAVVRAAAGAKARGGSLKHQPL